MRVPVLLTLLLSSALAHGETHAVPPYVEGLPEEVVKRARTRAAEAPALTTKLGALSMIARFADAAPYPDARRAFQTLAPSLPEPLQTEARLLAKREGDPIDVRKLGVVLDAAVLGPLRDTGGGLLRTDTGELEPARFMNETHTRSWGVYEVHWRPLPEAVLARGYVPLDLFVYPKSDTCTFVASRVETAQAREVVWFVAGAGQLRLLVDGAIAATDETSHERGMFDRLAARVALEPGAHLVLAKSCTGAIANDGSLRIRVTDKDLNPLVLNASSKLDGPLAKSQLLGAPTTPLSQALSQRAGKERWDQALARSLAGADDQRSPRLGGLLSALAAEKLPADELALLGFLSPSGAERTGSFSRALRASELPGGVRSFVERRMMSHLLSGQFIDWALLWAKDLKLDHANDSEACTLVASALAEVGTVPFEQRALAHIHKCTPGDWSTLPSAHLHALARLSRGHDPTLEFRALEVLSTRYGPSVTWASHRALGSREAHVRRAVPHVSRADDLGTLYNAAFSTGEWALAEEIARTLAAWSPNSTAGWSYLHRVLVRRGESVEAAKALRRARTLAPSDARIRAEESLRTQGAKSNVPSLASSESILARRKGLANSEGVLDRELYWLRDVTLHDDRRVSQLIHYAKEIVIAPRTDDELLEMLPLEGDLFEILRARVHRKDGGIAFAVEEHNEADRPRIKWPMLHAGDTIEVALRSFTEGPVGGRGDPPFFFLDYAGSLSTHPLLYNEIVVRAKKGAPLFFDVMGGAPDAREEKDEGELHVVRTVWEHPKVVSDEPLAPQMSEVVPIAVGSTFQNWQAFRNWYEEAVRGFTDPDDELRKLARELTEGKPSQGAKIRAIFNYVADRIRYVNFQSAESWLPNRPQEVLARREGDCDDKAILLIALLRAVGIEAEEVMVQTRLTGQPTVLRAQGAAIPFFDHGIAYIPSMNLYLDATSPKSRIGPLPSMDARASALRLGEKHAPMTELPRSTPAEHGSRLSWTLTLGDRGRATLRAEELFLGDGAFFLRTELHEPAARRAWVADHVRQFFSGVEPKTPIAFEPDLENGSARVRYEAEVSEPFHMDHGDFVIAVTASTPLVTELAPLVKRTLPLVLPPHLAPSHEAREIRIVPPKGATWGPLPEGGSVPGGEFGKAELTFGKDPKDPRVVLIKRTFVLDRHEIEVEAYPRFRAWLREVDLLFRKELRMRGLQP